MTKTTEKLLRTSRKNTCCHKQYNIVDVKMLKGEHLLLFCLKS